MEAKLIAILVSVLLGVANVTSFDNSDHDVYIPPLIRKLFHKMSAVMENGDLTIGLKYLRIVKTLHWLQPVKVGKHKASSPELNSMSASHCHSCTCPG